MQDAPEGPVAIAFPDSLILNILLRRLLADMSANSPASQAQTCSHICRYARKMFKICLCLGKQWPQVLPGLFLKILLKLLF